MKTIFYLGEKKISRKALKAAIGEETLKRLLKDAQDCYMEDPLILNQFMTKSGMLTIKFTF